MELNKRALAFLSAGHLVTDVNQGALPALLPFFKEALSLSYTTAGIILLADFNFYDGGCSGDAHRCSVGGQVGP